MKHVATTLVTAAALTFAPAVGATMPSAPGPHAHRLGRVFAFAVGTTARTVRLPGRAANFNLTSIAVNGNGGTMYAEGQTGDSTVTLYGHGVALRFEQRGEVARIVAVAIAGRRRVVVRYWLG